jgi:hypothetical protein
LLIEAIRSSGQIMRLAEIAHDSRGAQPQRQPHAPG